MRDGMHAALTSAFFSSARNCGAAAALFLTSVALAGKSASTPGEASNSRQSQKPTHGGWQIECVVSGKGEATSLTTADAKLNYALPRGVTSFIIHLSAPEQQRCFTLVNENTAAKGNLSIAVSKEHLPADSPRWSTVNGSIRFRHKRLFTISLVGIEANYVKLTFQVESPDRTALRGFRSAHQTVCAVPEPLPPLFDQQLPD
jgi:hypothetical protein